MSSPIPKLKESIDLLKKENYVLFRENKRLEQALKKARVLETQLIEMMRSVDIEIQNLKKQVEDLERREKQLPHILLTTWKLLSRSTTDSIAKKIFSVDSEQAIDFIASEFGLLHEDAKIVWNLLLFYR